jgi:hypothetical protein
MARTALAGTRSMTPVLALKRSRPRSSQSVAARSPMRAYSPAGWASSKRRKPRTAAPPRPGGCHGAPFASCTLAIQTSSCRCADSSAQLHERSAQPARGQVELIGRCKDRELQRNRTGRLGGHWRRRRWRRRPQALGLARGADELRLQLRGQARIDGLHCRQQGALMAPGRRADTALPAIHRTPLEPETHPQLVLRQAQRKPCVAYRARER